MSLAAAAMARIPGAERHGRLAGAGGSALTIGGLRPAPEIGARLRIETPVGPIPAEVIAFGAQGIQAAPFAALDRAPPGARVALAPPPVIAPSEHWLGRILDPLGQPLDGRPPPPGGPSPRPLRADPPAAARRQRLGPRLSLGVRALDLFTTCRRGQRLGLFAASGVGKSTLLSMLARHAEAEVIVLALVGERGRELREFIEDDLGPDGFARSVVICATSDAPPLLRRDAAMTAMAVAEHFRDAGKQVLLLVDSLTRTAMAMREIGLAAGEPPAMRGYPPSVFAALARLVERAGPAAEGGGGAITALFTVLVEGDDHDEPVADAVRGFLDGHVVLDRRIGERGQWPAVDVLRSLSRTVPGCLEPPERELLREARAALSLARELEDLVRLGAYRAEQDPVADRALGLAPRIEAVLQQARDEPGETVADSFARLAAALAPADG
jgi:flagellum-specific ATP synthase